MARLAADDPAEHYARGRFLESTGGWAGAVEEYRRVIRHRQNWPEAHYRLGVVLRETHRLDEAIAEFRAAIQLGNSEDARRHLRWALADRKSLGNAR